MYVVLEGEVYVRVGEASASVFAWTFTKSAFMGSLDLERTSAFQGACH